MIHMTVTQKVTQHWRYYFLEKVTSYFPAKVTRYFCKFWNALGLLPSPQH